MHSRKAAGDWEARTWISSGKCKETQTRTEPLLRSIARVDDLDNASTESLDGRDVVRQDTHITRRRRQVYLRHVG